MPNLISTHTLEDLHGSKSMNYESMEYVYSWMIEENQPLGIDYQMIRNDYYIEDSMTQHYMEFNEDCQDERRFWDHTFPKQSLHTIA